MAQIVFELKILCRKDVIKISAWQALNSTVKKILKKVLQMFEEKFDLQHAVTTNNILS